LNPLLSGVNYNDDEEETMGLVDGHIGLVDGHVYAFL
jgi:hypothetical protein